MAERLRGSEYHFAPLDELPEVDLGTRGPAGSGDAGPAPEQSRAADRPGDLGYFTIDVPDPDVTGDFFAALFGWQVEQGNLDEGRHIASIAPPGGIHGGRPVGVTLYFRVDDLAAAADRVRALGGTVESVDDYPSGGNASCRDPQGLPFELWKPAPGY
jgi:predicted enzyme related to lactoylglutathione lyase